MSTTTTAPTKRVTARPTTTNILKAFWQATPEEFEAGRAWYREARELAIELVDMPPWSEPEVWDEEVRKAVAVIAVLSPRLSWSKNVENARWIYTEVRQAQRNVQPGWMVKQRGSIVERYPGLKDGARKAIDILLGGKPEDVVSGPKVTAFYHAITDANDPRGIVIDRHAFDVAVGRVMDDKTRGIVLGRAGAYEQFVRAYERATLAVQAFYPTITPAEVQAVTWVTWRRLKKEGKV